jgi:hypothetical protein
VEVKNKTSLSSLRFFFAFLLCAFAPLRELFPFVVSVMADATLREQRLF